MHVLGFKSPYLPCSQHALQCMTVENKESWKS